jgi:phosphoglucosamine mutase
VAYLTRSLRADAGVVLSASHNPAGDNGIKFFAADGFKLPDSVELEIEAVLDDLPPLPPALDIGKAVRIDDARGRYIEFLKSSLPKGARFNGLKVVIDSANGAAYDVAPHLFRELGCEVVSMFDQPTGYNINQNCGSTYPQAMCDKVREVEADIGFALDGDADRLIACDASGELVDGDRVIAILAEHLIKKGQLQGGAVVTTLMSNMGLARFLEQYDVQMLRANVGDRYVLEMMKDKGCNLGGEQSGHMILLDHNTTGDGLMTALQLLCAMQEAQQPLSELAADLKLFPQKLWNIVMEKKVDVLSDAGVQSLIQDAESKLGDLGRVNVRASGTEPKLRVMVEAESAILMFETGQALTETLEEKIKALM